MKERILRLCKRLNKFSLDEIINIADDVQKSVLELILTTLIKENKLIRKGEIYFYNKGSIVTQRTKLPMFFQFHSQETIDLIVRCFCSKISMEITKQILQVSENSIEHFYSYFREKLYFQQFKELNSKYIDKPKIPRTQTFFKKTIILYVYNSNIYVSEKKLTKKEEEKTNSKQEICEFKKAYSYLKRLESHHRNKINLHYKIAESLWRRNKTFEELYRSLTQIIFI